jgi:hypothetical protein
VSHRLIKVNTSTSEAVRFADESAAPSATGGEPGSKVAIALYAGKQAAQSGPSQDRSKNL